MMKRTVKHRKRYMRILLVVLLLISVLGVMATGRISQADWIEEEEGIRYIQEDGQYAVGFLEIDEKRYYFDVDGNLVTGKFYVAEEDAYYFADEKGVLQYGAIQTEEDFFLTDEEGRLLTGFAEQDGKRYFFNDIAQLVVGWFKYEDNWYYSDGNGVVMTGFVTVDGYRYYFNADGTRVSDAVLEIEGITYVFNQDGSVDENATTLYPVFQYLNALREQKGCPEFTLNSKVQACAIIRASELVEGFSTDSTTALETLLANRGVDCAGGYEFAYGGLESYDIQRLMQDMEKDSNMHSVLYDTALSEIGLGVYVKDGKSYYNIIFIEGR